VGTGTGTAKQTLFYDTTSSATRVVAYVNGIKQVYGSGRDFVATTGTSVAFTYNLGSGDTVDIQVYELLTNAAYYLKSEVYTQTEVNSQIATGVSAYLPLAGGVLTGLTTVNMGAETSPLRVGSTGNDAAVAYSNASTPTAYNVRAGMSDTDDFSIWTSDTKRLTVKDNGNIGIGTTSPDLGSSGSGLHIKGPSGKYGVLKVDSSTTSEEGWVQFSNNNVDKFRIASDSSTNLKFIQSGVAERMRINSSGGVGINTNDAIEYMLDVGRDNLAYTSGKTMRINSVGDTIFSLSRQGTSLMSMRNDNTGYTCISSNNSSKLMLGYGTGDAGAINNHLYFTAGETIVNELGQNRDFRVEGTSNTALIFVSASANSVRFGKTTGSNNDAGVMWNHNDYLGITTTSTDSGDRVLLLNRQGGNGDIVEFRTVNSKRGSISSTTSGTTYNTTSDRRLKDNIQPIADATDKLMDMKPVTHTWIDNPEAPQVHGFIAQEMQEVVPEAVSGDPESDEMMSMDYGRITPVIVAALQDALKEIKELKTRINELEAK
jgi:hypothetical protein